MNVEADIMKTVLSTAAEWGLEQILDKPRVYTDLNAGWRMDENYVVPLDSPATDRDLKTLGLTFTPGLVVDFWTDDGDDAGNPDPLLFQGVIQFDESLQKWIAVTKWEDFLHASELKNAQVRELALV
jgi:hypothetical protein